MSNSKDNAKKMSKNRLMLIILCIFVALVLIFGIVLVTIFAINSRRSYFSFGGVRIEEGEASFFSAYYKDRFLTDNAKNGAKDTPEFWASKYDENATYGELLRSECERFIKEIAVKNYLFDRFCEFDVIDEVNVKKTVKEILEFKAEGSEEKFNEKFGECGFDFDDFESAAELLYKAEAVGERIYGVGGANMKNFPSECDKFFESYSHVKLLFIRTEDRFLLDSNGNRVPDENGDDTLVPLTEDEKAARQTLISEIRSAIKAFEDKTSDLRMTPEYFNLLLSNHGEGDPNMTSSGYYFSPISEYTLNFAEGNESLLEIVKRSLGMEKDTYAELSYSGGVCFIYKYANTPGAYTDTSETGCFSDFYILAADASYRDAVSEIVEDVKVSDKFSKIDLTALPVKNMFIPRF